MSSITKSGQTLVTQTFVDAMPTTEINVGVKSSENILGLILRKTNSFGFGHIY